MDCFRCVFRSLFSLQVICECILELVMKIAFKALIKQVSIKSLVSGDKVAEVKLQLQDENVKDEILNTINSLQDPTEQVMVVIMDERK